VKPQTKDGWMIVQAPSYEYAIHSLEKLRLGGLWNIYGSSCHICAGKASLAREYEGLKVNRSWHNILERHRRKWEGLGKEAIRCKGEFIVKKGTVLKSGIYMVEGDVRFYGSADGPITLLCSGKIIMRGSGGLRPYSNNVLFIAKRGVFLLGENTRFEGEICSLESEVRVLGNWLTFEKGGIYGRRIGIYGSNNAFF